MIKNWRQDLADAVEWAENHCQDFHRLTISPYLDDREQTHWSAAILGKNQRILLSRSGDTLPNAIGELRHALRDGRVTTKIGNDAAGMEIGRYATIDRIPGELVED